MSEQGLDLCNLFIRGLEPEISSIRLQSMFEVCALLTSKLMSSLLDSSFVIEVLRFPLATGLWEGGVKQDSCRSKDRRKQVRRIPSIRGS